MKRPVILDLETKHTFREYNEHKNLGVTVIAIYDYADETGKTFLEHEVSQVFPILERASYVIGYNSRSFDIPVLQAYYAGNTEHFSQFDILEDIREKVGRRLGLNDVAAATLGTKKSGHGLMAIDYYKEGKLEELKKYCLDDVLVTKDLFEYGITNGKIHYRDENGIRDIPVMWKTYLHGAGSSNDMPLTLPF